MKSNKLALAVAAAYLPKQWEYVRVVFQDVVDRSWIYQVSQPNSPPTAGACWHWHN